MKKELEKAELTAAQEKEKNLKFMEQLMKEKQVTADRYKQL